MTTPIKRCTPEVLAMMVDLLPTVGSLRDLCGITGLRLDTVRRETAPFLAIMKLNGTHPKCGCGRDRFHPYGCVDSVAKARPNPMPGHSPDQHGELLERRRKVIDALIDGERFCKIDRRVGTHGTARKYLRFLSPEQLAARAARLGERELATGWKDAA